MLKIVKTVEKKETKCKENALKQMQRKFENYVK